MHPNIISAIADVATAVVTAAGVLIATLGLRTWRKQLRGTTQYELAKRLLLQVYHLRDAIQHTRQPFLLVGEAGNVRDDIPWEVAAYTNRWNLVRKSVSDLNATTLECEVIWGDEINALMDELRGHVGDLRHAVETFNTAKLDPTFKDDVSKELKDMLYWRSDDDRYSAALRDTINKIKIYVEPHLRR